MKSYPDVDAYLADRGAWKDEMVALRAVVLATGVEEAVKWGKPCYSAAGGNVAIMQPFKDFLALLFVKGALMKDPAGVLEVQGEHTRSAKRMVFRSVADVEARAEVIRAYLEEAAALEASGAKVDFEGTREMELPGELVDALDADPALASAWAGLTPGRQRAWIIHFAGAKQSATRAARIEKASEKIFAGKGLNDR